MPFKDRTKEASPLEVEIKKVCARLGFCFAGLKLYLGAGQLPLYMTSGAAISFVPVK